MDKEIDLEYTNWKGDTRIRKVIPLRVWYGSTKFHGAPQWLLKVRDLEKDAERDFSMADCNFKVGEDSA